MFCPKCGSQNPETGKFCRSCGTDLADISSALAGKSTSSPLCDTGRRQPLSWEGAITKFAMGFAFLVIALILGLTNMIGGRGWWFWLLIPAFMMMGSGIAQYIQLKKADKGVSLHVPTDLGRDLRATGGSSLPPPQIQWAAPESRYKTGDLVPPSVTDNTTRQLELDKEGQTMALPKK